MVVYLNGEWVDRERACIPIDDRGFLYADGVFETCRLHGGAYFRLDSHLERLEAGAQELRLPLPDRAELREIARQIRERCALEEGTLRVTLTRGSDGDAGRPTLLATLGPIAADWRERGRRGWSLITAHTRHPAPSSMPSHIKALGRLHGILARIEAREAGVDDALLLSPEGDVAEGPTWNVFWRKGDVLYTPALDVGILNGVTRAAVLELAPRAGFEVREGAWPRDVLEDADEVFATMSSLGPVSIRALDRVRYDEARARAAQTLHARYWALVEGEAAAMRDVS